MKVYILHGSHWSQCGEVGGDWVHGVYRRKTDAEARHKLLTERIEAAPRFIYAGEWMHEYDPRVSKDDTEYMESFKYTIEERELI